MKLSEIGEFALINRIKKDSIFNPERVIQGIGDDAAVEKVDGRNLLVSTCDMLVENIHFLRKHITPWQLGYKSTSVNLSDIAAMGGKPTGILVSLGLPEDIEVEYIDSFYQGLKSLCKEHNVNLLGGDIVYSPSSIVVSLTALGEVGHESLVLRSGSKPGDIIMLTGTVGDSKAGLEVLKRSSDASTGKYSVLLSRHLSPKPPVREGIFFGSSGVVTSMNDISDGLANELNEIAVASSVGLKIYAEKIPISEEARLFAESLDEDYLDWALYGGEDYKIVLTCRKGKEKELEKSFKREFGSKLHVIGEVVSANSGIKMVRNSRIENLSSKGYTHF